MSVKEAIHQWVEEMPEDSPYLLEIYERARLNQAIDDARKSAQLGQVFTADEILERHEERCQQERSA